jgi:sugar lactone lactonase YvrE
LGPKADLNNKSLRLSSKKLTKIYERVEEGKDPLVIKPETIILSEDGQIFVLSENGSLVTLVDIEETDEPFVSTAKAVEVAHLGAGRPLSGKFHQNGCLYFVDVILGLARICLDGEENHSNIPHVELLASRVKLDDGSYSPINYADDIDIGPKTGHVYFSDATDVRPDRDVRTGAWGILYGSKVDGIRMNMSGRLLRYKPETGDVDILATGASFANGVAVDRDETYVLFISTYDRAVMKYYLKGEKAGQRDKLLDQFPGFLDGVDCSFSTGKCYVAMPSTVSSSLLSLFKVPSFVSKTIRNLLLMLPRNATPDAEPYGGFAEIDPGNDNSPGSVLQIFQDPDGRDIDFITGVTEFDGKVYLGSLHGDFIGVYDLN